MNDRLNKTLAYEDLEAEGLEETTRDLRRWVVRWFFRGHRLGVNGTARRRVRVRPQKLWEYVRGLALTGASRPVRAPDARFRVLDVGGAMTLPLFYLGDLGDTVVSLDIDRALVRETNRTAQRARLPVTAHAINLVDEDPSPTELGAGVEGFDRVYSFCVLEHIEPPGQHRVVERMARLLKPGGRMAVTFDYGENARSESPMRTIEHVHALRDAIGLPLMGDPGFYDDGRRYPISRSHPEQPFTFGSLFFEKPA